MKSLYIIGYPGSGKTVVALGLAQKLRQEGYQVGYFKPVANGRSLVGNVDMDAVLMKEVLGLAAPLEKIVPFTANPSYLSSQSSLKEVANNIFQSFKEASSGFDIMLIGGALTPDALGSYGLDSFSLARKFAATAIPVLKVENDYSLDHAIFLNKCLANESIPVIGTIFSNVPRPLYAKSDGVYRPIMDQLGLRTLGIIPTRAEIASPTVAEFYNVLGGELLTGNDRLNLLVEDVIIGAMTMEGALTYLRRTANKAVILGGDRADLALAALETSTSVLILTGGLYPDIKVIARAAEKKVPVILVHYDTYMTIERISQVSRQIQPNDQESIQLALESIERYCNWEFIRESL